MFCHIVSSSFSNPTKHQIYFTIFFVEKLIATIFLYHFGRGNCNEEEVNAPITLHLLLQITEENKNNLLT
jgi:hypothetical protein